MLHVPTLPCGGVLGDGLDVVDVDHTTMHMDIDHDTLQLHHDACIDVLVVNLARLD
jgi:hypothetical protein